MSNFLIPPFHEPFLHKIQNGLGFVNFLVNVTNYLGFTSVQPGKTYDVLLSFLRIFVTLGDYDIK